FQAEDGIRDRNVTGVQTCALPISPNTPGAVPSPHRPEVRRIRPGRVGRSTWDVDWGRTSRPGSRVPAAAGPRKVRAPPGTVVGKIGRASCRERVEGAVVGGGRNEI